MEQLILKFERNEYGKAIRKRYENKQLEEHMCNIRDITIRSDGLANTLTTVLKDNMVLVING